MLITTIIVINSSLIFFTFSTGYEDVPSSESNTQEESSAVNMTARTGQLSRVCDKYRLNPASPEYAHLHSPPTGPGVEVVLLPGTPPVTVCIPHKVGSHAWGVFSRQLADLYPARMEKLRGLDWRTRAGRTKRAVIVRHPLERLVSAYRMLFQVRTVSFGLGLSLTGIHAIDYRLDVNPNKERKSSDNDCNTAGVHKR